MKVICYGDSNTWGYDPRSRLGERYPPDSRWPDLLAAHTGWEVLNQGLNGRSIPLSAPSFPADTGLLLLMLGTNDLLQGRSPEEASGRLEQFLSGPPLEKSRILLIAPPALALGEWVPHPQLVEDSRTFARLCRELAGRLDILFGDAGEWGIPLAYDGVHFTAEGHQAFATRLLEWLAAAGPFSFSDPVTRQIIDYRRETIP